MALSEFPESILGRAVLREGFQYSRNEAVERTEMDSGLARGRLFNANPPARVPCQFAWSEFQVALFEAWLQDKAKRGAAWFKIWLPLEGDTYRQVMARVASVPPRRPRGGGGRSTVAIEFEIYDAVILPDGTVDLVLEFGADGVQQMAATMADTSLQVWFTAWDGLAAAA